MTTQYSWLLSQSWGQSFLDQVQDSYDNSCLANCGIGNDFAADLAKSNGPADLLLGYFDWDTSKEGFSYWADIYTALLGVTWLDLLISSNVVIRKFKK